MLNNAKMQTYNNKITKILSSENYKKVKEKADLLYRPIFPISLSKKLVEDFDKINDNESKNLIKESKCKHTNCRYYSIIELIKIFITVHLRKYEIHFTKIKKIIANLSNSHNKVLDNENCSFLQLEYFVFLSLGGKKILVSIDEDGNTYFFNELGTVYSHFAAEYATIPVLILPFFTYVNGIILMVKKQIKINGLSSIAELFKNKLSAQEKKILQIIRNRDYVDISIIKKGGNHFNIKAKSRQQGKFLDKDVINAINKSDYQKVTISLKDGKIVSLFNEESFVIK